MVLLPVGSKCPDFVQIVARNRSFTVSVMEDQKHISYSNILHCLGLNWEEEDGESSAEQRRSIDRREVVEKMA